MDSYDAIRGKTKKIEVKDEKIVEIKKIINY
jgi:hypothetical protein